MKILFFFSQTGTSGEWYRKQAEEELLFTQDTIRIYLRGCQNPNIGNSLLSPDLDIAADHIYNAFEGNKLNFDKLKANLGDGIYEICCSSPIESPIEIESIGLNGHSRGAVSTFAVAKKLDELEIPIDVVANQPVPGEITQNNNLTKKYRDLSQCNHIRSAHVFLATHSNYNAWWHNVFFKQLLPKFSSSTQTKHVLLPVHQHFEPNACRITGLHTNNFFSDYGYTQYSEEHLDSIKTYYSEASDRFWYNSSFIPLIERQSILGDEDLVPPDPVYLELQFERAMNFLSKEEIVPETPLKPEQFAAIDYLAKTYPNPPKEYVMLLLENTPKSKEFSYIINTVSETCLYVATLNLNTHGSLKKADPIRQASLTYQQTVFKLTYDFLLCSNSFQEQAGFKKVIYAAEKQFRKDALEIEMGYGRRIMKFLTNFALHITGIGMIANAIHKKQTGNWLFFEHNRSTEIIRDMRKTVFDEINPSFTINIPK